MSFEYTKDNHLKWGWGDEWFNPTIPESRFKMAVGQVTREVGSFRQECIEVAKHIAESATKPIVVSFSGGTDSQAICLAFKEAGIEFSTIIASFYDSTGSIINSQDTKKAYQFCIDHNIGWEEHKINLSTFYKTKGVEYAKKYGFWNVEAIVHTDIIDKLGNDYCYVSGEASINVMPYNITATPEIELPLMTNGLTVPVWWQNPQPVMQHLIENEYEGTTSFFLYTPEIMLSLFDHPVISGFLNAHDQLYSVYCDWTKKPSARWKLFEFFYKPMVVVSNWPEIIQGRKYTGFEKAWLDPTEQIQMANHAKLIKKNSHIQNKTQAIVTPIHDLVKHLRGDITLDFVSTKVLR